VKGFRTLALADRGSDLFPLRGMNAWARRFAPLPTLRLLQQVSELMSNPDVEVIGILPAELQQITTYSAGVTASAREAEAAKALIKSLTAPAAAPIFKAKGLDPL
jgi:hypothetical protein